MKLTEQEILDLSKEAHRLLEEVDAMLADLFVKHMEYERVKGQ